MKKLSLRIVQISIILLILSAILSNTCKAQESNKPNTNCDSIKDYEYLHITTAPTRGLSIGILYSINRFIFVADNLNTKELSIATFGIGYRLYQNEKWGFSFNIIPSYRYVYNSEPTSYFISETFHKWTAEIGFIKNVHNKLSVSFHWDILNEQTRLGIGIKY